jgi:hypothetical protein
VDESLSLVAHRFSNRTSYDNDLYDAMIVRPTGVVLEQQFEKEQDMANQQKREDSTPPKTLMNDEVCRIVGAACLFLPWTWQLQKGFLDKVDKLYLC